MILMILACVVAVAGAVIFFLSAKEIISLDGAGEPLGLILTIFGLVTVMITVGLVINTHSAYAIEKTRNELQTEQEALISTYNYLTSDEQNDGARIGVVEYNNRVAEFKQKIKTNKLIANNPLYGILVTNRVYEEFDENAVSYIGVP